MGDKAAVPALAERLKDSDAYARWAAAWALGRIGDAGAVPALLAALRDRRFHDPARTGETPGKTSAVRSAPILSWPFKPKGGRFYVWAGPGEALAMIGDPRVFPALLEATKDSDENVRTDAARALAAIDAAAIPAPTQALEQDSDVG